MRRPLPHRPTGLAQLGGLDGDLDLALIDETADEVILMQHQGTPIPALSTIGTVVLGSLLLAAGVVLARRSRSE